MAQLIPDRIPLFTAGDHMEQEVASGLAAQLHDDFRIYRQLEWSVARDRSDSHGELDLVVVAPNGAVALLEIKAGQVEVRDGVIWKQYGGTDAKVDAQIERQHVSIYRRLRDAGLDVPYSHWLVLPQCRVSGATLALPRERIIDSRDYPQLHLRLRDQLAAAPATGRHEAVCHFFENRLALAPDAGALHGALQTQWRRIAGVLATWVPRMEAPSGVIRVAATAGSGKTQLALTLLRSADQANERAAYVCFNRPLADRMAEIAPAKVRVASFHELCWDEAVRCDALPHWSQPGAFEQLAQRYITALESRAPDLDLLVIDEAQDLHACWVAALVGRVQPDGRLYVLEDPDQGLYDDRDDVDIDRAVVVRARENFRSPRVVVEMINLLGLARAEVIAASPWRGESPGIHSVESSAATLRATEAAVRNCIAKGHAPGDIAVVSLRGAGSSALLKGNTLGPWSLRRFTGSYDAAGAPVWTSGELLADTVRRMKGRSAPAVVLTEIDFETLDDRVRRLLFVGITRAPPAPRTRDDAAGRIGAGAGGTRLGRPGRRQENSSASSRLSGAGAAKLTIRTSSPAVRTHSTARRVARAIQAASLPNTPPPTRVRKTTALPLRSRLSQAVSNVAS